MTKPISARSIALLAFLGACAPIPYLSFGGADGGSTDDGGAHPDPNDATTSSGETGAGSVDGAGHDDAGSANDAAGDDATGDAPVDLDDAGPDASFQCGSTTVSDCALCAGSPLKCRKGAHNVCVSDCESCATSSLPCYHCATPDAAPRGTCLPINANGMIACAPTNLCACTVPADCTVTNGASQTCESAAGKSRCLTCGSPLTADAACFSSSGATGVCGIVEGGVPTCQ